MRLQTAMQQHSSSTRGHRLDSPVQRLDLQAFDGKTEHDHIQLETRQKNNALNWASTVMDCFFAQCLKVWDQRNLDHHGHDHQQRANKLKDAACEEAVPDDIRWLVQTPAEDCLQGHSVQCEHHNMDQQLGRHHHKGPWVTCGGGSQVDLHCGL